MEQVWNGYTLYFYVKMKKLFSIFALITIFSMTLFTTAACSSDDNEETNVSNPTSLADQLVGTFAGTVRPIGYSDAPETAYVTFTKMSSTAVKVKVMCSEWDMNLNEVIMKVSKDTNGGLKLEPEKSTINCDGSYKNGTLTLTFGWNSANWLFSGEK